MVNLPPTGPVAAGLLLLLVVCWFFFCLILFRVSVGYSCDLARWRSVQFVAAIAHCTSDCGPLSPHWHTLAWMALSASLVHWDYFFFWFRFATITIKP
uniref:Putative secreted protein n=1 Tax=Anopheles darlingi TaxID=43151 RepID=A0A2M4DB63_ANODA